MANRLLTQPGKQPVDPGPARTLGLGLVYRSSWQRGSFTRGESILADVRIGLEDLACYFRQLEDSRSTINQRHPFVSVLVIAIMGVLEEVKGPTSIATWAKSKSELAKLKELRTLNLGESSVGDKGMKELVGLKQLNSLILTNTPDLRIDLKDLADLKKLRRLDLSRSSERTEAGIPNLRKALPALEVLHPFIPH